MMYRLKCLLVLSVIACGATMNLKAQDDLEALLRDLGGEPAKKPAAAAPVPEPAPAVEEAAPAPAVVEEPAPVVQEIQAEPAAVVAEEPAAAQEKQEPVVIAEEPVTVAEEPAAALTPTEAAADKEAIISELMTLEKIRRQSLDNHGLNALATARKAFAGRDYATAVEQYKQAMDFIVSRPATEAAITEAREGMSESYYQDALKSFKAKDYDKALPLASKAKERGHPKAQRLIDKLTANPESKDTDVSEIVHRINEKTYKVDQTEIRRRLRRSRQFYTTGEYGKAQEECDLVLRDYPDNIDAMNMRQMVADRSKGVADIEFEATRSLMIRDVRRSWTPDRYAIESPQLPGAAERVSAKEKIPGGITGTKTSEQVIAKKLRDIVIPEVTFRPPATVIDAVDFFKQASRDYDDPEIPVEQRGVNLVLKLASTGAPAAAASGVPADPFAAPDPASSGGGGVPVIPAMSARFINLYDALKLVCDVTGMKFRIRGNIVMIVPLNDPDDELISRSYNVVATITDRVGAAQSELSSGRSSGGESTFMTTSDMGGTQDWKAFFGEMGVAWPDGSSISYLATIGKLRVKNTEEQLAIFEQVLEDLNVTPRLIEIEARFVEVNQNDLNSLGFEWLLNSDYSFDAGFVGDVLDLKNHSGKLVPAYDNAGLPLFTDALGKDPLMRYAPYTGLGNINNIQGYYADGTPATVGSMPGSVPQRGHNASIDGNNFTTGNRYLNTLNNPIAPDGKVNDQFMRINAFLGNADVSMILHMLSQRSDSDLLSAPKVVTKSGQEAIMKVVTEYIYPTEFQVTMSQQGNTSGGTSGGNTGEPLAIVEPQNFEMREVGVILQVVPEVSAEGQMINLMLNPQVVSEPVWKNYGTKIPKQVQRSIWDQVSNVFVPTWETEYTELPMEQPFFPVRSVSTQLSIYNGATVVMGGLINEQRTTIEDKVPFLGDIPYLGRLFRSRSEVSDKRNLLVFVTARLVDPAGRFVKMSGDSDSPIMGGSPALAPADMSKSAGAGAGAQSPF